MSGISLGKRSIAGKFRELATDSATYGASNVLGRVITFLLLPLYTRYLDTSAYGALAMLNLLGMLFIPIGNLGMANATFRHFNLSKDRTVREEVFGTALVSTALWSTALFAVCQLFAGRLTEIFVSDLAYLPLVRITLWSAYAACLSRAAQVMMRADRRAKLLASINLGKIILSVLVTVWLVIFERSGVAGVVVALLIADVAVLPIFLTLTLKRFRPRPSWERWRQMSSYGLPFVPHQLQAIGIAAFGVYMVRFLLNLDEAGIYNVAVRFSAPVALIVTAIQTAWIPFKFQIHAEDDAPADFFSTAMTYYVFLISFLWVGIAAWGPELVRLMTAEAFHGAAFVTPLVAAIPIARGIYFMAGSGFEMSNDTRVIPVVSFAGLAVVVGGAFLLIPELGGYGAAIATICGWVMMAFVIYYLAQRRFKVRYDWKTVGGLLIIATAIAVVTLLVQRQPLMVRLAVATVVSLLFPIVGLGMILLGGTDSAPLHRVLEIVRTRKTRS